MFCLELDKIEWIKTPTQSKRMIIFIQDFLIGSSCKITTKKNDHENQFL